MQDRRSARTQPGSPGRRPRLAEADPEGRAHRCRWRRGLSRRRAANASSLLAAAAVALILLAAEPTTAGVSDPVYMQIVAHQDDDFLFMNPDVGNQIAAGNPTVTVYITAGQAAGAPGLTREQFAAARQRGMRAAYAQMAGAPDQWTRTLLLPDAVHDVELYTLDAAPWIRLIFMNLTDGGDVFEPRTDAMSGMWEDPTYVADTIVPACFISEACFWLPVRHQLYDRAGLLAVLRALVATYQPIVVRTLDPQPFESVEVSFDNTDHTAAARFADAVLADYHGPFGTHRHTVTHYKGYSFLNYPQNLGLADYLEKAATAAAYDPHDPNYATASYDSWYWAMWERYPASTTWLERASDGRLVAVSVEDRQVLLWHETVPGGTWSGPALLPGTVPLAPHLTLLRRPDGLLQLFALRLPLEREHWFPDPAAPLQEVVTAVQLPGAGAISFGPWSTAGSPDAGACAASCQFAGVPTAAIDGGGRTFVFAKSSGGLVSYAHASGGPWSAWATFATQDIVDGIAAHTRDDGRVEAFATTRSGELIHFVQVAGTASFIQDGSFTAFGGAASAPTVTRNADGRPEIFYREAGSGRVLTVYETRNGTWAGPVVLFGDAGVGPVAAIRRAGTGHIMLFERNVWAGISATWQVAPNDVFYLQWQVLGGYLNEYPAATTDAFGRVVVAVKGGDGRLYLRREASAAVLGSFGPWAVVDEPCRDGARGGDTDLDGQCGDVDNCPIVVNPRQEDTDASGIGNHCECGDQSGDGRVNVADILAINEVIFERQAASALCDTNDDGLCNVADILGVNAKIFGADAYCARYPGP